MPRTIRLAKLHTVLQITMGWGDEHLHEFITCPRGKGPRFGSPDPGFAVDFGFGLGRDEVHDERRASLGAVIPRARAKLIYVYDFGDGREHDVLVEKSLPPEPNRRYPVCVEGARACPPEDCGGPWGYMELVELLGKKPRNAHERERLAWLTEWYEDGFDLEAFDLDAVNQRLGTLRLSPGPRAHTPGPVRQHEGQPALAASLVQARPRISSTSRTTSGKAIGDTDSPEPRSWVKA